MAKVGLLLLVVVVAAATSATAATAATSASVVLACAFHAGRVDESNWEGGATEIEVICGKPVCDLSATDKRGVAQRHDTGWGFVHLQYPLINRLPRMVKNI